MTYIVYQITNTVNGKRYIGYSVNAVDERWSGHLEHASAARRGKCKPTRLTNAINKYGKDAFVREVLFEEETLAGAKETEILTILDRDPDYNMTLGGDGLSGEAIEELRERNKGNKYAAGRVWREESLKQLSESQKKSHAENPRIITDEWLENLSKAQTGRKHPQEVKDKIGAKSKGRILPQHARDAVAESNRRRKGEKRGPLPQETKDKISASTKGREPPNKGKKVSLTAAMIEGNKKSGETRRGKKRGPYKLTEKALEAAKRRGDARRGKKLTEEHKRNISEGHKARSNKEHNDG